MVASPIAARSRIFSSPGTHAGAGAARSSAADSEAGVATIWMQSAREGADKEYAAAGGAAASSSASVVLIMMVALFFRSRSHSVHYRTRGIKGIKVGSILSSKSLASFDRFQAR